MPRRLPVLLPLLLAVALVAVPTAGPAEAADTRPRVDQESWLEWQVADALSSARQSPRSVDPGAGEPAVGALTGWDDLRAIARDWSDSLADRGDLGHNPAWPDAACCWSKAGEVVARLTVGDDVSRSDLDEATSRAIAAWFGSPPHRQIILDGAYDHVGVGVTIDHAAGEIWITADLRATQGSPPGNAWYPSGRSGASAPTTPTAGWPCDSDVAPYGADRWPLPDSSLVRRGGDDRVATALAVASGFSSPSTVLVASAATPTDALAAAGLAGTLDAPVLLTAPDALDGRVADRLASWRPDEVVLLGGTGALSGAVERQVDRAVPSATVDRAAGGDRFDTAATVAQRLADAGGDTGRVVLALGAHADPSRAWADAVTVSGLAAAHRHPVLLSAPGHLPGPTRDALAALSPSHVIVPGGASGVSDAVLAEVRRVLPGARVDRVAGADRYATSRAVVALDRQLRGGATRGLHLVDGESWPDALTAGPAAAAAGGTLALVRGDHATTGGLDHVEDLSNDLRRLQVTLVGGEAAISDARAAAIRGELHCL